MTDIKQTHLPENFDAFHYTLDNKGDLYLCSLNAPQDIETMGQILKNPFGEGGMLFFLDKQPTANWGHECVYIFVKNKNVYTIEHTSPPTSLSLEDQEKR